MQELAKILEEIDLEEKNALLSVEHTTGYKAGALYMANTIKDIIRNHMNDGWIPVEERLPEEKTNPVTQDFYEYQVTAKFQDIEDIRHYKFGNGHWWHGPGIVDQYVVAWRPLPEPYIPRNQNKPEERYPEWRAKLLNKFDRRE